MISNKEVEVELIPPFNIMEEPLTSTGGGGGGSTSNSDVAFRDGGDGGSGGGVSGNQHSGTAVGGDASPDSDSDRQGYPGAGPFGTAPQNAGAGGGGGGELVTGPMDLIIPLQMVSLVVLVFKLLLLVLLQPHLLVLVLKTHQIINISTLLVVVLVVHIDGTAPGPPWRWWCWW